MASEFEAKVVQDFAEDIAGKLSEAAIIARTASTTLIHDASVLFNAASVVRRREKQLTAD